MSTVREIFETMEYGPAPEAPDLALDWLKKHQHRFHPFIDGRFRDAPDAPTFESINPRNGQPIAKLTQCGQAEVDAAVAAAAAAFPDWSGLTGHLRARYLYAIARQIQKHSRLFAVLETLDNGRYTVSGSSFLSSCRMGSIIGRGVSWIRTNWGLWPDYSLELSVVNVGLEDSPGVSGW